MKPSPNTCRGFALAGLLCVGISLIIGGALLSLLGIVFAAYGYVNAKRLVQANAQDVYAAAALRLSRNVLIFGIIAGVLNLLTAVLFYPALMDAVSTSSNVSAF